jgi:hypothetical protein
LIAAVWVGNSDHILELSAMQSTNDAQIRELLIPFVHQEHSNAPDTIFLEEFALYGGTNRADLAAFNGVSHGYEIKSDRDTLLRLPHQVTAYSAIFERATLVSSVRHLSSAQEIIPWWWGIVKVKQIPGPGIQLERIREASPNPAPLAAAIAALLWRSEALNILENLGLDRGVRSKPMEQLIARLSKEITVEKLSSYVREALRARGDWRSAARLRQYDDSSQLPSSRLRYQRTPYGNICR